jgi:hypothetical protein
MSNINSRARIIIVTTLLAFCYFLLQEADLNSLLNLNFNLDPVKPILLAFLVYIGAYWALFFKVTGERLITILLFPAIGVFAISFFFELVILSEFSSLGQLSLILVSTVIFWVFTYLSLLTINILNAAYTLEIPLGQAARASQFIISLVISYLVFFVLFSNDIFIFFRLGAIFGLSFILIYISLWSIKLRFQQRMNAAIGVSLLLTFAGGVLSTWPVPAPYIALVLGLILYVCLGIALEIRDIISRWIWVEYLAIYLLIIVMLVLIAEWGINGTLI